MVSIKIDGTRRNFRQSESLLSLLCRRVVGLVT